MLSNKKEELSDEFSDSGLGSSFPEDVEEKVKTLTIQDSSEVSSSQCTINVEDRVYCRVILTTDQDGDNALHLAIANGREDYSLEIISLSSLESINAQNHSGQTPLMVAVLVNMQVIVRKLIEICANLKLCDSFGNNIIHLAAEYGNDCSLIEIIRSCKSSGTKELFEIYLDLLNTRNHEGFTPFHVAIRKHKFKTARILVESGADVNAVDYKGGFTSLHHLVQFGNFSHIQQFIDEFQPDVNAQSYSGLTPLHLTLNKSLNDVADLLLLNGADTEIECMDGIAWSSAVCTL